MPPPGLGTTVDGDELRSQAARLVADEEKHLSLRIAEDPPDSMGDVPVQTHLAYGDVADCVVRHADRGDIDLMVLSSRGSGAHSHAPLG